MKTTHYNWLLNTYKITLKKGGYSLHKLLMHCPPKHIFNLTFSKGILDTVDVGIYKIHQERELKRERLLAAEDTHT